MHTNNKHKRKDTVSKDESTNIYMIVFFISVMYTGQASSAKPGMRVFLVRKVCTKWAVSKEGFNKPH